MQVIHHLRSEESKCFNKILSSSGAIGLTTHRFDYDLTKTFDVLVGKEPNQQRFTVYHDILTQRSEFFRAARSGRWTIQPDQATVLDDHEPDVFSVYLHCVTFGRKALEEHIGAIPVTERIDSEDTDGDYSERAEKEKESTQGNPKADEIEDTQTTALESDGREESDDIDHYVWKIGDNGFRSKFLVDLYLLADKLIDPVTANMAIDKLIRVSEARNEYPGPRLISYVYESTTTENPLRRLCRDWYLFAVDESWVDTLHHDSYPHAFMKDLVYETYDLQRNNQRKRVHKAFAAEKLAVRRTNKYYHQKVNKASNTIAMPQRHHQEDKKPPRVG